MRDHAPSEQLAERAERQTPASCYTTTRRGRQVCRSVGGTLRCTTSAVGRESVASETGPPVQQLTATDA